jgi:hypothetical protein
VVKVGIKVNGVIYLETEGVIEKLACLVGILRMKVEI